MSFCVCRLNSGVECVPYHLQLSPENALQLIQQYPQSCLPLENWKKICPSCILSLHFLRSLCWETAPWLSNLMYDIVADCSDNVPTRYLVNDACVLSGKPLVSASALRMEGQVRWNHYSFSTFCFRFTTSFMCVQLTVYNYHGGPCYRCLYPAPPPPQTVTNCSDGGVLGVGKSDLLTLIKKSLPKGTKKLFVLINTFFQVPGIMGCLQALEVLKIASGQGCILLFSFLTPTFNAVPLQSLIFFPEQ